MLDTLLVWQPFGLKLLDWVGGALVGRFISSLAPGQKLKVAVVCPRCNDHFRTTVPQCQPNYVECGNCHRVVHQVTNVCQATLDPESGQVGHVVFHPRDSPVAYHAGNQANQPAEVAIPFTLCSYGLPSADLVLELWLKDFVTGKPGWAPPSRVVLHNPPATELQLWRDVTVKVPSSQHYRGDHGEGLVAGPVMHGTAKVLTGSRDVLAETQRLFATTAEWQRGA